MNELLDLQKLATERIAGDGETALLPVREGDAVDLPSADPLLQGARGCGNGVDSCPCGVAGEMSRGPIPTPKPPPKGAQ